jgi:predicted metal-binding membrane protein
VVRVDGGDGHADAGRLDDVHGVDADARSVVAGGRGVIPRDVDRDDGGDDAAIVGAMLWRFRQGVQMTDEARLARLTAIVAVGYFVVWTWFGIAAYPIGVALAAFEMQHAAVSRAVPIAIGVMVMMAGLVQLTAWKARHLDCCRQLPGSGRPLPPHAGTAWRHGLRLGLHCSHSSAGLMVLLLVIGVMDLRAMALVTGAITLERLAPAGRWVARAIGVIVLATGLLVIGRAAGLG